MRRNKPAVYRLDLVKRKRPVMDLQQRRVKLEENQPAAKVRPENQWFPV